MRPADWRGSGLDEILRQEAHDDHVDVPAVDEVSPPATSLFLEPDLLVGTDGPGVDVVDGETNPLEVHLPKTEPAQRADGVGPIPAVPVGPPDPYARRRGSHGGIHILHAAHPDQLAGQGLDGKGGSRWVLADAFPPGPGDTDGSRPVHRQ